MASITIHFHPSENPLYIANNYFEFLKNILRGKHQAKHFIALPVNYVQKVEQSINRGYLSAGGNYNLLFWSKLLATKYAPKWKDEQEMRFVLVNGIGDNDYFKEVIPTSCITKVTLGKDVDSEQTETIKQIVYSKYNNIPVEYRKQ